jgi:hypothetical protein
MSYPTPLSFFSLRWLEDTIANGVSADGGVGESVDESALRYVAFASLAPATALAASE